ncbi:ABC transporter ATP-binding protein [Porifericola rhodea]|uniref:ABC transporter ATP-binding protein n=1 Tax=Porifericola rhodea TaxID=930972 RepID=UPI0026655522|nr:ABC transporter ATP-binding protein [Porifericola rhodea]WKN33495.1 ABC transporter ATP-binding protein [Porifericola rhodea]
MDDIAIKVENLSKLYAIGNTSSGSLKETVSSIFSRNETSKAKEFWALQDVSFEVKRGEAFGIIGKNGAGKSTLLKLLSRITEPTTGRIEINGRVSSLLEVGTGFHPELTGRENIFLNGTILGMSRSEVKEKFDEIVDFSGVEKFLDTPVKRYSSGMKVRLAFAVAAHLEPEILIIDEVLAVGDAEFQKKCLGKMEDVAGQGRTVLFVSHNMSAVRNLCSQAIQLVNGQIVFTGDVDKAIDNYMDTPEFAKHAGEISWGEGVEPKSSEIRLIAARIKNGQGTVKTKFDTSEEINIEIDYQVKVHLKGMRIVLKVNTHEGILVFASTDHYTRNSNTSKGFYRTTCKIPSHIFNKISYSVDVQFGIPGVKVLIPSVKLLDFEIENLFNTSGSYFPEKWPGMVAIPTEWDTKRSEETVS